MWTNLSQAAIDHDFALEWKTLHSRHFEVHFHDGEQQLAEKTVNLAEHLLIELQEELQTQASDTIEIVLSDEQDYANGFVHPPSTHLRMTIFPTAANEQFNYNDWLTLLIKHELSHVLHLDKSKGNPASFKSVFGRHPLLYPNLFQPLWLIEGYATYQETDRESETGRGQGSIFRMMMRTEVENGLKPLNQVNLNITSWPTGVTRYLYGYYFFEFLEITYGKESITRLIDLYSDNLIPYRLNHNTRLVYGKSLPELWQDFSAYLNNKFQKEIDQISSQKIVSGEKITSTGFYKLYAQPMEDGNLLYAEYDGINRPRLLLKKFKLDKTEIISELQIEARLDTHPEAGILVSQIEMYRNTNAFYDLYHLDLINKELKRLTRGDRFRNAIWNPSGDKILATYNKLGKHSLVLLNKEGHLIDLLWEGEQGEYISGIDWSPDSNNIIASVKRKNNNWNLEEFNIAQRSWKALTANSATESQPQYSPDGKSIYFSADYDGIFNIQKLNLETRTIDTLTHVLGGAFSPTINNNEEEKEEEALFYIGYSASGYDVFRLDNPVPLKTVPAKNFLRPKKTTAAEIPKTAFEIADYSSFAHIKPTWWTPTLWADNESVTLGAYTSGSDALNRHAYDAYLGFDFRSTSLSGEFNYSYDRWFPLFQTHLETTGRKKYREDTYQFEVLAPLLSRDHNIYLGTQILFEKETTEFDNSKINHAESTDSLVGIGVLFDSRKRELLSVSPDNGRSVSLTAETSDLFGGDVNGKMLIAKWKEYISIKPQHVLAFRFVGGFGLQSPRPFQLGGHLGDTDYQSASFLSTLPLKTTLYNNRRYALRGYPSDAPSLIGRRMMLYNLEWRFPLTRIERSLNMLPVGIHQLSSTVFAESGSTWTTGNTPENYHYSVGTEVHFHTEWFYFMPIKIRVGYAYGIHEDGEHQAYFSLSSSF